MKPSVVMKALKEHVRLHLDKGGKVLTAKKDSIFDEIKEIVGDYWATNDRGIALAYSHDPSPIAEPRMPDYVILPNSTAEISAVIKLLNSHKIPYAVRGNGSSAMGFVMSEGAVIDLSRMKAIDFDEKNWLVKIGPGVAAFDLQKEAVKRGLRVNIAEPSAMICANIMCSGMFSIFSASYGTAADNYIDAEFVGHDGAVFRLNDKSAPNFFAFKKEDFAIPGICSAAYIKLHPVTSDESAVFVPFESLKPALDFTKECAMRRIGIGIGVLGGEYISTFLSPTKKLATAVKNTFKDKLKIEYLVIVIGDKFAINSIKEMKYNYFDTRMIKILNLGLPSLTSAKWLDLLDELADGEPFSYLGLKHFSDLAEVALAPSATQLVKDVDPELRPVFEKLYSQPEMTDPVWLNMFRIVSARMGREKHLVCLILFLPIDNELITEINNEFKRIADKYELKNDYGFITPLDNGKRCIFEYDYYLDHNDPDERIKMKQALKEAEMVINEYSAKTETITWIRYIFNQGFSIKENFLYSVNGVDKCPK
jgi:hypothetical protein